MQRRHRFYRHLFVVAVLVLASLALPFPWHRVGALGTMVLVLLLAIELGQPIRARQSRFHWNDRLYRLEGILALLFETLWIMSPRQFAFIGFPVLIVTTAFIAWSLRRLLICLSQEARVGMDVLGGAVAGYLLLGIVGGLLFSVLETIVPGSFVDHADKGQELLLTGLGSDAAGFRIWDLDFSRIDYFAFVSLTTVGYGDIIPATPLSQVASVSLSICGPLYLAIVMGLLISRYTLQGEGEEQVKQRDSVAPGPRPRSDADWADR
ncbi:MAG: potassium channel family protein [Synechococcus sp.]|jgi:voltage-gated potassium channel|nr:potassium channel family protein [Synechococcus sp.]